MEPSRSRVRDKPASSKLFAEPTTQNTPGGDYPELASLPHGEEGLRIVRDFIGDCRRCKLCHGRNQLVFGEGAAGELLSKMIKAMGEHALKMGLPELASRLRREEVYIGNVVKCRPPGNRTPEPDEVSACGGFITAQLACLAPRVIVALGRTPTQFLLQNNAPLGRLRGQFGVFRGVPVMPTYHPAYLLRAPSAKAQVWEDLKLVISRLAECQSETQPMAQL
jgi:DNA polymerase